MSLTFNIIQETLKEFFALHQRSWMTLFLLLLSACVLLLIAFLMPYLIQHVIAVRRLSSLNLPTIKGMPFIGLSMDIVNYFRSSKKIGTGTHILTMLHGMSKMFPDEGILRLDVGYVIPAVMVYRADTVEAILKYPKTVKKTWEYFFTKIVFGNGLPTSSPMQWRKDRKQFQPSFHPRILETYQPGVSAGSQRLVEILKPLLTNHFDSIEPLLFNCALDNMLASSLGYELENYGPTCHPFVQAVHVVTESVIHRVTRPWLWLWSLFTLSDSGKKCSFYWEVLNDACCRIIASGSFPENGSPKMEGLVIGKIQSVPLYRHLYSKSKHQRCQTEIVDHTRTFVVVGVDSPGSAMVWIMYLLGLYADVQKKAFEELNKIFEGDLNRSITIEDLKKMVYLECAIKECLRVIPIIPMIGRSLEEDLNIGGHMIPKGTSVYIVLWSLHRDPKVFPNPEIFDPDRFLNRSYSHFEFAPFSSGPRGCIGYMFAMQELKTVFANLLRNFQWSSLDPHDVVFPTWGNLTIHPAVPIRLAIQQRKTCMTTKTE